jgi:hypothetical protein
MQIEEAVRVFGLTQSQCETIELWKKAVKENVMKDFPPDILQPNEPYFGAIGSGMTYSFTPTGLGMIITVKYGNEELDLTEYDKW